MRTEKTDQADARVFAGHTCHFVGFVVRRLTFYDGFHIAESNYFVKIDSNFMLSFT